MNESNMLSKKVGCGAAASILYELIFILLPIGIIAWVYAVRPKNHEPLVCAPEWAFAAIVLAGQTAAKLMSSASKAKDLHQGKMLLLSALLFVVTVFAIAGLLTILLVAPPPHWVCISQVVLLGVAALAFFFLGTLAHVWADPH